MEKKCTVCKEPKDIGLFRVAKGYKDGRQAQCKMCEADRLVEWRKSNPLKVQEQNKRNNIRRKITQTGNYSGTPERARQQRCAYLRRTYGITADQYDQMAIEQNGQCMGCGNETWLVVDHCHKTGIVRGLLCDPCNRALGCVRDNPETLLRLSEYVTDR